jgi:copper chaperone CopZ
MRSLKTVFLIFSIIFLTTTSNIFAQDKKKTAEIKIQTSAQCGMCKDRIENMFAYEKGVKSSNLDLENKIVTVIYNPEKTTPEKLRIAISKLGYDADDIPLVKEAYDKLPECCKKPAPGQKVTH